MSKLTHFMEQISKSSQTQQSMTKIEARNLIETRMRSKYSRAECRLLKAIVDGIPVSGKNWQMFDIHSDNVRCSTLPDKLMRKAQISPRTIYRTLPRLTKHLVTRHRGTGVKYGQDEYSVHLDSLKNLPVFTNQPKDRTKYFHKYYEGTRKAKTAQTTQVVSQ